MATELMLEEELNRYFGFSSFRKGQREAISSIMNGRHTLAMLPTGTGKSICYQLPGYLLEGTVLIVSPLLSLMQDQVEQMKMNGEKRVVALNSFLSFEEKRWAFDSLQTFKYIFISPEMLTAASVLNMIKKLRIALFVVDEAHCISQWGYDFRPDYLRLGDIRKQLGNPLTLALTATATPETVRDIISRLEVENCEQVISSVDRPNISLTVEKHSGYQAKASRLRELVQRFSGPGIIYFSSKKMAEQAALSLKEKGSKKVMAYHGGMDQESRILIQQQFVNGQIDIVCATSAFGMGINKSDIRFVVHFHMPLQLESYLQEIGRAGRDGKASAAVLLWAPGDEQLPLQLAEAELPSEHQVDYVFSLLKTQGLGASELSENEKEIRLPAGLTDIQWRVLTELSDRLRDEGADNLPGRINEFLRKRVLIKNGQIAEVGRWIHSKSCRREKITEYFQEGKKPEIISCCDICGLDLEKYFGQAEEPAGQARPGWKELLAGMLINK
ncbi:RecQ family ATP-dependent DNA helicase [Bacillus infantis]|uniref:RecQ family ATP-dependent DNA helicase n=1 Tax=Bacillus infantis TaxID=324767 RepID=UPI002155E3FF|nr:ATP-dependent DNA helicase RecQ [Bacillus infantis]MCR6611814.1 ATP-dependent DNA helicase [Bacillus infantis]